MRPRSMRSICAGAVLLAAALPLAAQLGDDILQRTSNPPHHIFVRPDASSPSGIFPDKMKVAYGFSTISNQGQGQTIAIVDAYDDPKIESDLGVFSSTFNLPACTTANGCFTKIYASGIKPLTNPGWALEIALDVEWAHAIAPQAKILLVEATNNLNGSLYRAVDVAVQHGANVVSMSFSGGESSSETTLDSHFNVSGVTFVASSGDSGNGVGYPAASPYVVGVGGTTLSIASNGAYQSETAWSGSGGGVSRYETEPSYQAGVQQTGFRGVPDVSYDADPSTGVPVYDTVRFRLQTGWFQVGGTSMGSPQIAAMFAIADSLRTGAGKSTLDKVLFNLYPLQSDFHDVTSGTNGSCGAVCSAGAGYDFVTGLGSPAAVLITALAGLP